jgi:opacity protein-like surface antigen
MRKSLWVVCACLLGLSATAMAQDYPKVEVGAGYSYLRTNVSTSGGTQDFNGNGASGNVNFSLNHWLGVEADLGGYTFTPTKKHTNIDLNIFTYMFGPRLSLRTHSKFTPYVHVLFGGAHGSGKALQISSASRSQNAFAMAAGGGFDYNLTDSLGIRIVQAEYVQTRFDVPQATGVFVPRQDSARLTFGIVWRFGGK